MPGLVDAHCHVGLDAHGGVSDEESERQAVADRDAGALLLRDCGSPVDTSWIHDRDDLPRLIRAGRHIARTRRYIRNYAHEVEPDQLAAYVAQEAQRGDGWVKLVGDWIERDSGDLAPSFPAESFAEAIAVAHAHGAKVTAHCFGEAVLPGLIEAGIDCIEHGTGLSTDLVDAMVERRSRAGADRGAARQLPGVRRRGGARSSRRTPPTCATSTPAAATRSWRRTRRASRSTPAPTPEGCCPRRHRRRGARARGYGFKPADALGAASWHARAWLGHDGTLAEGTSADFVVRATRWRTSPRCASPRGWCCAARSWPEPVELARRRLGLRVTTGGSPAGPRTRHRRAPGSPDPASTASPSEPGRSAGRPGPRTLVRRR